MRQEVIYPNSIAFVSENPNSGQIQSCVSLLRFWITRERDCLNIVKLCFFFNYVSGISRNSQDNHRYPRFKFRRKLLNVRSGNWVRLFRGFHSFLPGTDQNFLFLIPSSLLLLRVPLLPSWPSERFAQDTPCRRDSMLNNSHWWRFVIFRGPLEMSECHECNPWIRVHTSTGLNTLTRYHEAV
jgi:hypothetical protein